MEEASALKRTAFNCAVVEEDSIRVVLLDVDPDGIVRAAFAVVEVKETVDVSRIDGCAAVAVTDGLIAAEVPENRKGIWIEKNRDSLNVRGQIDTGDRTTIQRAKTKLVTIRG